MTINTFIFRSCFHNEVRTCQFVNTNRLAELPESLEVYVVNSAPLALVDDVYEVVGQHERDPLTFEPVLLLEVAQEVTEVDVEQLLRDITLGRYLIKTK